MSTLGGHFRLLKSRIEPDPEKAEIARDMPAKVREHLQKHPEFATEDPHTRLAGSYARRTAIKTIKDVDILVILDQDWREKTIKEILCSLKDALKELPETLGNGNEPELRNQRRSINVYLPKDELSLDIVPVLRINTLDDMLEVPDRDWDEWIYTHPLGYASLLSKLNSDNGMKVVPLIKMIKHWRDEKFTYSAPKSYWLESLVVRNVIRGWITTKDKSDDEIVADLFDSIYDRFLPIKNRPEETPFIPDAMLRNHVAWNWKRSAFETFMNRLEDSKKWARLAVGAKDGNDIETAVKYWKKVFGESFPSTEEVEAEKKEQKAKFEEGQFQVTSSGKVLIEKRAILPSIPSPKKRFFGGE